MSRWYRSDWEQAYELRGPIREDVLPLTHYCSDDYEPNELYVPPPAAATSRAALSFWGYLRTILSPVQSRGIVDLGGGGPFALQGVVDWSLWDALSLQAYDEFVARDMRDIEALRAAGPFSVYYSSHSIEHVEPNDVPEMLAGWVSLLRPRDIIFISGPHRCCRAVSPILGTCPPHVWAPTAACVGNFLVECGLELLSYNTHNCPGSDWYVSLRKR